MQTVLRTVWSALLVAALTAPPAARAALTPSETFTGSVSLIANDVYHLFWKYDNSTITFEVHVQTKGWVGFGISPNGNMAGSDIVIGWVADGVAYFKDRYAASKTTPTVDSSQDWVLLAGSETNTHTVLKFQRPLLLCDSQDRNITAETMRAIYAYTTTDPSSHESVAYHSSNRGAKSMMFLTSHASPVSLPSDAFYIDYLNRNATIPHSSDTTYWCSGFNAPNFTEKHHLIRMEPIVQTGNEAYVHHVLLYACFHEPENITTADQNFVCYTENMPWGECDAPFVAWGFGGTSYDFPEHVGLPFGENAGTAGAILYIRMETHYDNPNLTPNVVDASGLRVWFTKTLRTYDAGLLEAGMQVNPLGQILPGGFDQLRMDGHCSKECLSEAMGTYPDIKVFSTMLHSHLLGTGVRVRHYKDGVEKAYLDTDLSYDFNYQETRIISPEITITKGDNIIVECYYNTASKTVTSFAGLGTTNEMCLAYISYYPRINVTKCQSVPTQMQMASQLSLNYTEYNSNAKYGTIALITNGTASDQPLHDYIGALAVFSEEQMKTKYQQAVVSGQIFQTCKHGETSSLAVDKTNSQMPTVTSSYSAPVEPCGDVNEIINGLSLNQNSGAIVSLVSALLLVAAALTASRAL